MSKQSRFSQQTLLAALVFNRASADYKTTKSLDKAVDLHVEDLKNAAKNIASELGIKCPEGTKPFDFIAFERELSSMREVIGAIMKERDEPELFARRLPAFVNTCHITPDDVVRTNGGKTRISVGG